MISGAYKVVKLGIYLEQNIADKNCYNVIDYLINDDVDIVIDIEDEEDVIMIDSDSIDDGVQNDKLIKRTIHHTSLTNTKKINIRFKTKNQMYTATLCTLILLIRNQLSQKVTIK